MALVLKVVFSPVCEEPVRLLAFVDVIVRSQDDKFAVVILVRSEVPDALVEISWRECYFVERSLRCL
jgi:hypothetical protein